MSVLERLVRDGDGAGSVAGLRPSETSDDVPSAETEESVEGEEVVEKKASDVARELIAGARDLEVMLTKVASEIREDMEKTASEGSEPSDGASDLADLLEKTASTLRVQRVYAESLRKHGAQNAKTVEALDLASDLMERGLLDVPEGQSMAVMVHELAKQDLNSIKVASKIFPDAALANALGSAEKVASESPKPANGSLSSWMDAHAWLMQ